MILALVAAGQAACTYETLEGFDPGKGVLVSKKRATLEGTVDPDGFTIYPCETKEEDWACLKRVSETLLESGTKVEAELTGKIASFVATFVIDGQRFQGEYASRKEVMRNYEHHQKSGKTVVLESVLEKMDPSDRHVVVKMDDHNAIKDDAAPKMWMVWRSEDPDLFASLGHLEKAAKAASLQLEPGKWRQDGNYEFALACP